MKRIQLQVYYWQARDITDSHKESFEKAVNPCHKEFKNAHHRTTCISVYLKSLQLYPMACQNAAAVPLKPLLKCFLPKINPNSDLWDLNNLWGIYRGE